MRLKKIKLTNFRNFDTSEVELSDGATVFYGGVGEGKSNLLEAIFLLSVGRSYRTSETNQVIGWGHSEAYVRGEGENSSGDFSIAIKVSKIEKRIELNGENGKKSIDLFGGLRTVIFHADDIAIVSGGPYMRRRFLDLALSQASKNYVYSLRDYYRILKQRNSALSNYLQNDLGEWDEQLSKTGAWITQVRAKAIDDISNDAAKFVKTLSGENEDLEIKYLPSGDANQENFKRKMQKAIDQDVIRGTTSVGPHRDELKIMLGGVDARFYSSSGEKKTITLALKLAELEFIRNLSGEKPILLLDDLFSTLDIKRSKALLSVTGDGSQCVITTTDMNLLKDEIKGGAMLFEVDSGIIKKAN
jgi:DNA replication and repair protein RecF